MEIKRTFTNLIHDVLHQQYLSMLVIQHGIKNDRLCHEEYLLRPLAWFCSQKSSMYACCMVNDSVGWARDPETTLNLNPMLVNHLTMIWTLEVGQCSPSCSPLEFLAQGRPFFETGRTLYPETEWPGETVGTSASATWRSCEDQHPGRHLDILCHFMSFMTWYILIHDIFPLYMLYQMRYLHCTLQ